MWGFSQSGSSEFCDCALSSVEATKARDSSKQTICFISALLERIIVCVKILLSAGRGACTAIRRLRSSRRCLPAFGRTLPREESCEVVADRVRPETGSRRSGEENVIYAHDEGRVSINDKAPALIHLSQRRLGSNCFCCATSSKRQEHKRVSWEACESLCRLRRGMLPQSPAPRAHSLPLNRRRKCRPSDCESTQP